MNEREKYFRLVAIQQLNRNADDVHERLKNVENEFRLLAHEKKNLAAMFDELEVTEEEACWRWQAIHEAETKDRTSEDERIVDTASDLVDQAYKHGKYDGREMVYFLANLLERIDPQLRRSFETAANV
ncbi:MAG: hypothetical protein CMK32_10255 [Porticoccaceae bacterium]|nr:hypothetical protein [Porticoccaceae bacterium]